MQSLHSDDVDDNSDDTTTTTATTTTTSTTISYGVSIDVVSSSNFCCFNSNFYVSSDLQVKLQQDHEAFQYNAVQLELIIV